MSDKTYVIRGYHFGYNDECFGKCGDYKVASFETKEEAEKVYKKLEIKDARQFPLKDMEFVMCSDEDKLQELDAFVYEKCGQHILNDDELIDDVLPRQLSDEDTFGFINKANAYAYQLVEFSDDEANKKYWVAYFPHTGEYLSAQWVNGVEQWEPPVIYHETIDDLKMNDFRGSIKWVFDDLGCTVVSNDQVKWLQISGTLADLTEQPLLLQKIIDQYSKDLKYQGETLSINLENESTFWAVNELLINPYVVFEQYTLEELEDEFDGIIDGS